MVLSRPLACSRLSSSFQLSKGLRTMVFGAGGRGEGVGGLAGDAAVAGPGDGGRAIIKPSEP